MLRLPLSKAACLRGIWTLLACTAPLAVHAQSPGADADPTLLSNVSTDDTERDRQVQIGLIAAYTPIFVGSKDYQLIAGPTIQARYDRLFLSFPDGLGYDVIRSDGWRAGPIIGFRGPRQQDGDSPLALSGSTDALLGLGTVKATADVGGYVAYERGNIAAKIDVRQAVSQNAGLIATLGVRYAARIPVSSGSSAIVSIGPRLTIVDDDYNQTYFGVTPAQSARSGLREYRAGGGILSYGIGASALLPLTDRISGMLLASYDRLAGDAASSPLVEDRGSRNQATVGLGLTYKFGL